MSPDNETPNGNAPDAGLFGRLPRERPGVRSPRRDGPTAKPKRTPAKAKPPTSAKPSAAAAGTGPTRTGTATPGPRPAPRSEPPAGGSQAQPDPSPEAEPRGGIDDLAWAGIAVAAEAATAGLRIVNRALDAMREAVERR